MPSNNSKLSSNYMNTNNGIRYKFKPPRCKDCSKNWNYNNKRHEWIKCKCLGKGAPGLHIPYNGLSTPPYSPSSNQKINSIRFASSLPPQTSFGNQKSISNKSKPQINFTKIQSLLVPPNIMESPRITFGKLSNNAIEHKQQHKILSSANLIRASMRNSKRGNSKRGNSKRGNSKRGPSNNKQTSKKKSKTNNTQSPANRIRAHRKEETQFKHHLENTWSNSNKESHNKNIKTVNGLFSNKENLLKPSEFEPANSNN